MEPNPAPPTQPPEAPPPTDADRPLRKTIDRIAFELDRELIASGDRAALRRHRPGEAAGPAFWKLAVHHLEPDGLLPGAGAPQRDDLERRWAVILAALAELSGLHRRGFRLGRVLAEAGVAEARVLRLLRARGEALARLVLTVVHQLASGRHPVDALGLAELLLSDGRPSWEERVRRFVAEDFYRTGRQDRTKPKE
jgi:CRISPR system Cascade subunit CasB